ncbi:Tkl protein kinase, partial [Globisporangium splendens]
MGRRVRKKCRIDPPDVTTRSASTRARAAEATIESVQFLQRVIEELREELRTPSLNAVKLLGVLHLLADETSSVEPGIFHCAVEAGRLAVVQYLVEKGADVKTREPSGLTPLAVACKFGHLEIAQFLVSRGAQIISSGDSPARHLSLLNLASRGGHLRTVQWLVENDVDVEESSYGNETALIAAAANGHFSVVKYLIAAGANPKKKTWAGMGVRSGAAFAGNLLLLQYLVEQQIGEFDEEGNKFDLLHHAARGGHASTVKFVLEQGDFDRSVLSESLFGSIRYKNAEIAELFLKYGADVNAADVYGKSVLYYAIESEMLEIAEFLMTAGADLKKGVPPDGFTAVHAMARVGSLRLFEFAARICEDPVEVFSVSATSENVTPLEVAVLKGSMEIVDFLLQILPSNFEGEFGNTLLSAAAHRGHLDLIKLFLSKGAPIEGTRSSALLHAAMWGNYDAIQCLCENGADVNYADTAGRTALHMAARTGNLDIVEYLLEEHAANPNLVMQDGLTVLDLSVSCPNIVRVLLAHNADVGTTLQESSSTLCLAIVRQRFDVIDILVGFGANVNAPFRTRSDGEWDFTVTPLIVAAMCGEFDILDYLCANGAEIEGVTDCSETALYFAAERGNFLIVDLLVEDLKADVNHASTFGYTPTDVARCHEHSEVLDFLLVNGALPPKKDLFGLEDIGEMTDVQETYWNRHSMFERFIEEFII